MTRFGYGAPTATEGMMYPVPYADFDEAVQLAILAERLGFDSVWGNDHVSTQDYVRREFADPPRFYDLLTYLAVVGAHTDRIELGTCVLVMPFQHPVRTAKQLATLDVASGGRVVAGVGVGAYRQEYEAMFPGRRMHRGDYVTESIESLRCLFDERRASYSGDQISFTDVESHPKPASPIPILSGGNSPGSRRRAATIADGWLPACLTVEEVAHGVAEIGRHAAEAERSLDDSFRVSVQFGVSIGQTEREAVERFERSQLHAHLHSLSTSTMRGRLDTPLVERNLVGTPAMIAERITDYREAGVSEFAGLLFADNTVSETIESMYAFAESVLPLVR